jgi:membrane protein implicated in regulation of membrane protease activity
MSTTIKIAKANQEGDYRIKVEDIKDWKIKTKTNMGTVVYITTEDGTYSISRGDYEDIFGNK